MEFKHLNKGDIIVAIGEVQNNSRSYPSFWGIGQEFEVISTLHKVAIDHIGVCVPASNHKQVYWLHKRWASCLAKKMTLLDHLENAFGRCVKYCEKKGWL